MGRETGGWSQILETPWKTDRMNLPNAPNHPAARRNDTHGTGIHMGTNLPERTEHYRHLKLVYSGQSSQLWKARDERDGKTAAVKRLLAETVDRQHAGMLKKEIQVLSALGDSKYFVHIYETGKDGKIPYVAMEWFPAPSVGELVKLGYEVYAPVLPILIPLMFEPLVPFHEAGWIHRDIKPDNFLFAPDMGIKLIDFAIAIRKGEGAFARLLVKPSQTQGTATYMPPEQIENKTVTERSDLYSLGCTILELLTDAAPFSGNTLQELLKKHISGNVPSAAAKNRNVTPQFDAFLKTLMSPRPEDRPSSAREALAVLKRTPIFFRTPQSGDKLP